MRKALSACVGVLFLSGFASAYSVIDTSNIDVNKSSFTAVSGMLYSQEIADPQRFQHGVAFFTLPENMELSAIYDAFRMGRIIDGQPVWLTPEQYAIGFVELERPLLGVFPYEGWERGVDYAIDISGSATRAANNKRNDSTSHSRAKAAAPEHTTLSVVFERTYSSISRPNGESIEQEVTDKVRFSPGAMLIKLPDDVDVMTCGGVLLARVIDQQLHWIERTEYSLTLLDTEEPTLMIMPSEGWEYGIDYAIRLLETVKNTDGYPVNEYGSSWKSGTRTLDLVRNETGAVTVVLKGVVPRRKQASIPNLMARYLYDPYGQAHIELGPELRSIKHAPELTTNDGVNQEPLDQGGQDNPVIGIVGSLVISMSIGLDSTTLAGAVVLRELIDGVWVTLGSGEVVIAQDENDAARVLVMPVGGFLEGRTYEVMLGPGLKDIFGRFFTPPDEGANHFSYRVSVPIEVGSVGETLQGTPKTIPIIYDSAKAAAATLDCRENPEDDPEPCFPGGMNMLFQGAWTDPTAGLAYHRNRWYDPRTASWLSPDPKGAVDSENLYAFVGWGPHMRIDPMGLHYFTTKTINGIEFDLAAPDLNEVRRGELALRATYTLNGNDKPVTQTISEHDGQVWALLAKTGNPLYADSFKAFYGMSADEVKVSMPRLWLKAAWHHKEDIAVSTLAGLVMAGGKPKVSTKSPKTGTTRVNLLNRNISTNSSPKEFLAALDEAGASRSGLRLEPGDAAFFGRQPPNSWVLSPRGQGAHMVERVNVSGRSSLSAYDTPGAPRYYPDGAMENAGQAHIRIHRATRAAGIKLQGGNPGTSAEEILAGYERAYADPSLANIRGTLRSPNGNLILGENLTPSEAFARLRAWAGNTASGGGGG